MVCRILDPSYIGWIRRCLPDMCCIVPRYLGRADRRERPPGCPGPRLARTRQCIFPRTRYKTWLRPAMVTRIHPDGKGRLTRPPRIRRKADNGTESTRTFSIDNRSMPGLCFRERKRVKEPVFPHQFSNPPATQCPSVLYDTGAPPRRLRRIRPSRSKFWQGFAPDAGLNAVLVMVAREL